MGPLVTAAHLGKVAGYIATGESEGAEVVVDGRGVKLQGYENGFWLGGTLLDRVTPEMSVYKDEIFGPVLSVVARERLRGRRQAGERPTPWPTALPSSPATATRRADFANAIQVGMVGVNVPIPVPVGYHSFGGWKHRCSASHGVYGRKACIFTHG